MTHRSEDELVGFTFAFIVLQLEAGSVFFYFPISEDFIYALHISSVVYISRRKRKRNVEKTFFVAHLKFSHMLPILTTEACVGKSVYT